MRLISTSAIGVALSALLVTACAHAPQIAAPTVPAARETPPVGVAGDAADDPAIWVASDPSKSRIIGTQKQGGLYVYDLSGAVVQEILGGRPNNIDLRDGFAWPEGAAPILAASDRIDNTVTLWRLDPATGKLEPHARTRIPTGFAEVYGVCLGKSGADFIVVATSKIGEVTTWRIAPGAAPTADKLGSFTLGQITEGCVVDDAQGALYTAEEPRGIWRSSISDPNGGDRALIDRVGKDGNLVADVEGLAIWLGPGNAGYLIASSQGDSCYAVYDRAAPNAYRGSFRIGPSADGSVDGVSGTDGIDVISAPLGPDFPRGVFVAQDDENTSPTATQDFKFVSWAEIEKALGLPAN